MIVKLPKKGALNECGNWRGITLLSTPGRVFCSVLLNRLKNAIDARLREEQAGFRPGRSCSHQIFILRDIIEKSVEYNVAVNINFTDFKKAFDSVHRVTLWKILKSYGIPNKFINVFKNIYFKSSCCIKTANGNTNFFEICTGVRQGCILSPVLFSLAID